MAGCGVCGSGPLATVLELNDHQGRPTALGRCPDCSLVQAIAIPTNEELEHYYSKYCYSREASWVLPEATLASVQRIVAALETYREANRSLDVGCGAGAFLTAFARAGWQSEGTELSEVAVDRLTGNGFRIHRGAIEDLELPNGYDVAVLSEVLEHLRDPRAALANTARALRQGGVVYLTTPNFASLSRRVLRERWRVIGVPEHLYYFSPASLRALLKLVGLRPVRIWTEGLNPFELLACARSTSDASRGVAEQAQAQGETLRQAAIHRPSVRAAKATVNFGLRVTGLGDTLKCIAARA